MKRALLLLAACSSAKEPAQPPPPRDAALVPDGLTAIGKYDPSGGAHLDDDVPLANRPRQSRKDGKPLDITLRSSPPGAMAAIDGVQIGRTPTFATVLSGAEHDFTFVLDGYALARYRFVPIQSGIVHAQMEAVAGEVDAGIAPPPEILRQPTPPPVDAAVDAAIVEVDAGVDAAPTASGPLPF